jgi:hypothetical protein
MPKAGAMKTIEGTGWSVTWTCGDGYHVVTVVLLGASTTLYCGRDLARAESAYETERAARIEGARPTAYAD